MASSRQLFWLVDLTFDVYLFYTVVFDLAQYPRLPFCVLFYIHTIYYSMYFSFCEETHQRASREDIEFYA